MKLFVVLPAYNEAGSLPGLFASLEKSAPDLPGDLVPVLVDDGSTDGTADIARRDGRALQVQVVVHEKNQGLGAALKTGIKHALAFSCPEDVIVLLDADNTHNPNHITEMVRLIGEGFDVVIASRYAPGGKEIGLSPVRRVGSRGMSFLLSLAFPMQGALDYTCGFRAYRASILTQAFSTYGNDLITETSFVCMAELLVKLYSVGARIGEVPLVLRYDLKGGASKMNIPKTVWRYAHWVSSQRRGILGISARFRP